MPEKQVIMQSVHRYGAHFAYVQGYAEPSAESCTYRYMKQGSERLKEKG